MVYEVVTFQALREQLRCKEIWVVGADSWRNPDEDLPWLDVARQRGIVLPFCGTRLGLTNEKDPSVLLSEAPAGTIVR